MQASDIPAEYVEELLDKLGDGLREGGHRTRWLLYAAAIKSMARGHRHLQLPASLGLLAALAGESIVLVGGVGSDRAEAIDVTPAPGLEQMLADAFGGAVVWHKGRDPIGRQVPEAGVAGASADDDDDAEGILPAVRGELVRGGEGVSQQVGMSGNDVRGGLEAACDTAEVWVDDALVTSVTHAGDSWQLSGEVEQSRGVIFQLDAKRSPEGVQAGAYSRPLFSST